MAGHDALSLLHDESMGFTSAIEKYLELVDGSDLSQPPVRPKAGSLEQQAWLVFQEIIGRCFELGAASIKFSHEVIAFLSSPDEINSAAARSRGRSLVAAIEDITATSTELQKAAKTALDTMSALEELDFRAWMDINLPFHMRNPWYLSKSQHLSLEDHAAKLGQVLCSINVEEIATTGVTSCWNRANTLPRPVKMAQCKGKVLFCLYRRRRQYDQKSPAKWGGGLLECETMRNNHTFNNVIAVFQGHIVRVCLHGLSLTERFGPSLTANIDSPLMSTFYQEDPPGAADYVGVLANYTEGDSWGGRWNSDNLMEMLDKDIISMLMQLETHLSNFLDEMALPFSELLKQYVAAFTSLLSAFSPMLAIEQYLDELATSNTHLLVISPSAALQPLLTHREASQRAITKAQSDVNFLISRLKQFQEDSVVTGWPTTPENVPEPLKCTKCVITNLLSHSEEVLARKTLAPQKWMWVTPEPKSGVTLLDAIRFVFSESSRNQRAFHLTIFKDLFPYHQAVVDNSADLDIQLPRALQPPSPIHLAFGPHHDLQSFWSQLSLLASEQPLPSSSACALTLSDRWRPCTCKKQIEFVAQSRRSKSGFQVGGQGNPAGVANLPKPPSHSKKTLPNVKESGGGSFQGNWSF